MAVSNVTNGSVRVSPTGPREVRRILEDRVGTAGKQTLFQLSLMASNGQDDMGYIVVVVVIVVVVGQRRLRNNHRALINPVAHDSSDPARLRLRVSSTVTGKPRWKLCGRICFGPWAARGIGGWSPVRLMIIPSPDPVSFFPHRSYTDGKHRSWLGQPSSTSHGPG
jgi:hypothetical protein